MWFFVCFKKVFSNVSRGGQGGISPGLPVNLMFHKNNYNTDFVGRNTHSNTDSNTQTNVNFGPVTTATLLYIRGTSETIAHIYV